MDIIKQIIETFLSLGSILKNKPFLRFAVFLFLVVLAGSIITTTLNTPNISPAQLTIVSLVILIILIIALVTIFANFLPTPQRQISNAKKFSSNNDLTTPGALRVNVVEDNNTLKPIEGAVVRIELEEIKELITPANGHVIFSLPPRYNKGGTELEIFVEKAGYVSRTQKIKLTPQFKTALIRLKKKTSPNGTNSTKMAQLREPPKKNQSEEKNLLSTNQPMVSSQVMVKAEVVTELLKVELVISGTLEELTHEKLNFYLQTFVAAVNIDPNEFEVRNVEEGSIKVTIVTSAENREKLANLSEEKLKFLAKNNFQKIVYEDTLQKFSQAISIEKPKPTKNLKLFVLCSIGIIVVLVVFGTNFLFLYTLGTGASSANKSLLPQSDITAEALIRTQVMKSITDTFNGPLSFINSSDWTRLDGKEWVWQNNFFGTKDGKPGILLTNSSFTRYVSLDIATYKYENLHLFVFINPDPNSMSISSLITSTSYIEIVANSSNQTSQNYCSINNINYSLSGTPISIFSDASSSTSTNSELTYCNKIKKPETQTLGIVIIEDVLAIFDSDGLIIKTLKLPSNSFSGKIGIVTSTVAQIKISGFPDSYKTPTPTSGPVFVATGGAYTRNTPTPRPTCSPGTC